MKTKDFIIYKGKQYPIRTFIVTIDDHDDGWEHRYSIAPESLYDIISFPVEDDGHSFEAHELMGTEEYDVDSRIYHYVEDEVFELSATEICNKYLDIPMTLIEEVL